LNVESHAAQNQATLTRMKLTPKGHREEVGRNVMLARESLGLTPKAFGAPVGLSSPALWNIETGKAYPNLYVLARICEEYGFTADYLLFGRRGGLPRDLADRLREREEA
jgi:transcriptional regulator with XRE-family HTH domain